MLALTALLASAQIGVRDRYFSRYPFDEWLARGDRSQIHWAARIQNPKLNAHQRLSGYIEIEIDAKEVEKRRGRGEIAIFVQIEDSGRFHWRIHDAFSLVAMTGDVKSPLIYRQEFFIVPGDYKVSLAICDSKTREYSLVRRTLHVAALRGDPLPAAWRDLQPVEFIRHSDTPDIWFQPNIRGRLSLPLKTRHPVHLDLVMNLTPSERIAGSDRSFRRNMSVLVPALKLLSNLQLSQGTLDVALLDLTRRKSWVQKDVRGLDWNRMRAPFAETNPGVIDAQSLAAKEEMTQFFWDRLLDCLRPDPASPGPEADPSHVVIVLSAPAFLDRQSKIEPATLPKDPNRRVFYLRYRPTPPPRMEFNAYGQGLTTLATVIPSDDIEHTLKSLDPRIYTAITPEEFRKALSNLLAEVGKM